jgi:hypothetical protein
LPSQFQQSFVDAVTTAARGGINVGRSGGGGIQLPAEIPPQVASQVQQLFHDVFASGFVAAIRPTLLAPVIALLLGAVACVAIESREKAAMRIESNNSRKH